MKILRWSSWPSLLRSQRGMSLIELLVTVGILSIMIAVAVPRLNSSILNLPLVEQSLIGDIRMARAHATTQGAHYRVSIYSDSYSVQRLVAVDGVWEPDSRFPAQTVELPHGVSFSEGAGAVIEFTTRGLLADQADGTPAAVVSITVHDALHNETKTVEVWPSGQVEEV